MLVIKNVKVRLVLKPILLLSCIPLVLLQQYAAAMLLLALVALFLFLTGFDQKKTGTRRLILVAVFVALSCIGRFIPFLKPMTALVILSGMYLGGEAGFLTGAFTALISNLYFGQGPWTPFQMLSWGVVGLAAGVLSKYLQKSRLLLILFGAITGFLFSAIMDIWTVLWYNGNFRLDYYLTALLTALPHMVLYMLGNVIFLILFFRPFHEKMSRIKDKYGI